MLSYDTARTVISIRGAGVGRNCMRECAVCQSALIGCLLIRYVPKSNVLSIMNVSVVCWSSLKSYIPFIDVDEDAIHQKGLMHR